MVGLTIYLTVWAQVTFGNAGVNGLPRRQAGCGVDTKVALAPESLGDNWVIALDNGLGGDRQSHFLYQVLIFYGAYPCPNL